MTSPWSRRTYGQVTSTPLYEYQRTHEDKWHPKFGLEGWLRFRQSKTKSDRANKLWEE